LWSNIAAGEQGGCKQGAGLLGQFFDFLCGAGTHDAAADENDRAFRLGEFFDQLFDLARVGRHGLGCRQDRG
jgi:hypothetical protein